MIVKSLDDIDVEVTFCDAGYPPGAHPNPILNTSACWCKPANARWFKSPYRSAMQTANVIRHTNAADLLALFIGKEIVDERPEASSSGDGSADATEVQSLQGHSVGNADEESAGRAEN